MNTRRKRRRVSTHSTLSSKSSSINEKDNEDNGDQEDKSNQLPCHTLEILPPEVLEMILRLLPLTDVAGSVRLVSRRFTTVATAVLNRAFTVAGIRLESTMNYVKSLMSKAATETEVLACSKTFTCLELLKMQYTMLKAVTWRYTHPPKSASFKRVCFYAGSLLDELNNLINLAKNRPVAFCNDGKKKSSKSRLADFANICKRFMNYFEKVSEYKLNSSALVSGCKAVDVLDCLAEGRQVMAFRVISVRGKEQREKDSSKYGRSGTIITMGLRYVMRRTWFTCLQVPCAPGETSWREDQRFMYLRLRRLVECVNENHYKKSQYEREVLMRASWAISQRLKPPSFSSYCGYGVYAGRFFYYGNMNKTAYESKFKGNYDPLTDDSEQDTEDDAEDDDDDDESQRQMVVARRPPTFDLVIRVDLRCSSDLAPLAVTSSLRKNELDEILDNAKDLDVDTHQLHPSGDSPELYLKLNITCPASSANRLSGNFIWEQWGPPRPRQKR